MWWILQLHADDVRTWTLFGNSDDWNTAWGDLQAAPPSTLVHAYKLDETYAASEFDGPAA